MADADRLFRRYHPRLLRRLQLWLTPDDADEVAHVAMIEALGQLERFDEQRSFEHWVWGIAQRQARSLRRTTQRSQRAERPMSVASPEERLEAREGLLHATHALLEASAPQRLSFMLSRVAGWGVTEISTLLGATPQTTWARIQAAEVLVRRGVTGRARTALPTIDLTAWPVVHVRWPSQLTLEAVRAHFDDVELLARHRCSAVLEFEEIEFPEVRVLVECVRRMTRLVSHGSRPLGLATVTPSRFTRGLVKVAFGLTHVQLPVASVETLEEGVAWCRALHQNG
jgi:RNA polymerase sigma factor (sigma-70 family)